MKNRSTKSKRIEKIQKLLIYAGKGYPARKWLLNKSVFSFVVSALLALVLFFITRIGILTCAILFAVVTPLVILSSILNLSISADKRARAIEKMLPSALQLIAANIRAGMTPDRAIWLSARPEFGQLEQEIKKAGSETLGGTSIENAFKNMSKRVKSRILKRTVGLIVEGMNSGGELAQLLTETAAEIRALDMLQKEMRANVAMYSLFVVFASLIGAPLLLGISTFFVDMLTRLASSISIQTIAEQSRVAGITLLGFGTSLTSEFLIKFSVVVITITTFFAALLTGLIKKGNEKRGLEYAITFVPIGLIVFFLVRYLIVRSFGSVIGF